MDIGTNYTDESVFELHLILEELLTILPKNTQTVKYQCLKEKFNTIALIYNKKVKFEAYTTIK